MPEQVHCRSLWWLLGDRVCLRDLTAEHADTCIMHASDIRIWTRLHIVVARHKACPCSWLGIIWGYVYDVCVKPLMHCAHGEGASIVSCRCTTDALLPMWQGIGPIVGPAASAIRSLCMSSKAKGACQ